MSMAYLGNRFEIHGGGADLIFPHHESERAQSEGATGERPFVEFWTHAGMLYFDEAKMSKSLGNLVLVRDLLERFPGDVIRHYLVSQHYRSEVHYREEELLRSVDAVDELRRASLRAERFAAPEPTLPASGVFDPEVSERRDRFLAGMDDDLDTPRAMAELHGLAALALADGGGERASQAGWMVRELGGRILGLRLAGVPSARPVAA